MTESQKISIIQMNDSHAYFDLHPEVFWEAGGAGFRPAGGYARIAAYVDAVRAALQHEAADDIEIARWR